MRTETVSCRIEECDGPGAKTQDHRPAVHQAISRPKPKKLKGIKYLVQGTLYPDVIESVSFKGPSATIKTHHNVGGLPARMKLKLIEPLRELFKDEVRVLGNGIGIAG